MKTLPIILTPTLMLIICCILENAAWYYYPLAILIGNIFGILALLGFYQLQKLEEMEKLICKKCGKTCGPDDYNEFMELCADCDAEEVEKELDLYYKDRFEKLYNDVAIF